MGWRPTWLEDARWWLATAGGSLTALVTLLALVPGGRWRLAVVLGTIAVGVVAALARVRRARTAPSSFYVPSGPSTPPHRHDRRVRRLALIGMVAAPVAALAVSWWLVSSGDRAESVATSDPPSTSPVSPTSSTTMPPTSSTSTTDGASISTTAATTTTTTTTTPTTTTTEPPQLSVEDVRLSATDDRFVVDAVVRHDGDALLTDIILNQVFVYMTECGGGSGYDLTVEPDGRLLAADDGGATLVLAHSDAGTKGAVETVGRVHDFAAGCRWNASIRLRPQATLPAGEFSTLRIQVPFEFRITESVEALLPGEEPLGQLAVGESFPIFSGLLDWEPAGDTFGFAFELVARTSDGRCDSFKLDLDARPFAELPPDRAARMRDWFDPANPLFDDCAWR